MESMNNPDACYLSSQVFLTLVLLRSGLLLPKENDGHVRYKTLSNKNYYEDL